MGSEYAYAFGRVKALEVSLINSSQVKRMIDARTAQDVFKIIAETPYGVLLPENPRIPDVERAILAELKRTYEIIRKISPKREITDLFEVKYDIHNMKIFLKEKITGKSLSHLLIPLGREGPESLKAAFQGNLKAVSSQMAAILVKAETLSDAKDFQKVEFFLDREHAHLFGEKFRDYPFLKKFFALKIDLENIRNFLRAQRAGLDFEEIFLPCGNFDLKFFTDAKDQPVTYLAEKTENTAVAFIVEGIQHYEETGSLAFYEKRAQDFLMECMRKARFYPLSVEPLVCYLYAKEREAAVVRQIIISKLKGVEVRDRVGEVYE